MCLITTQKEPLIAEKDILVWKLINKNNVSLHQRFFYSPNKLFPKVGLNIFSSCVHKRIFRGYHAFRSRDAARIDRSYQCGDLKVVKFYIPKGAKYYIGDDNDIVADRIRSGDLKAQ